MRITVPIPDPRAWLDAVHAKLARPAPPVASAPASPRLTRRPGRLGAIRTLPRPAPAMNTPDPIAAALNRAAAVAARATAEITALR